MLNSTWRGSVQFSSPICSITGTLYRALPCGVEPHVDLTIYFAGRPVLNLGARWNGVAVGNVVALAITAKLPAVKRALNGLAYDLSVDTQVRT